MPCVVSPLLYPLLSYVVTVGINKPVIHKLDHSRSLPPSNQKIGSKIGQSFTRQELLLPSLLILPKMSRLTRRNCFYFKTHFYWLLELKYWTRDICFLACHRERLRELFSLGSRTAYGMREIFVNARHTDAIFIIDGTSGSLIWTVHKQFTFNKAYELLTDF